MLHAQEPLHGQLRFDGHTRTFGAAYLIVIVLHLLHESGLLQVDGNLLAHVEAVLTHIHASGFGERGIGVEDVDGLEVVFLAQHVVVHIVCGGNLQASRTEVDVDVIVLNDGDDAVDEGHNHLFATQPVVLGVGRVDAHGHVAHDGFGTRGGHHGITAALVVVYDFALLTGGAAEVVVGHVVLHVVKLGVLFLIYYFLVGECGLRLGVPVDHAHASVDESFAVEVDKDVDDALRTLLVHGESRAVPVARGTDAAQLLQNDAAVLLGPVPGMAQELLAGDVLLVYALCLKFGHDLALSCN